MVGGGVKGLVVAGIHLLGPVASHELPSKAHCHLLQLHLLCMHHPLQYLAWLSETDSEETSRDAMHQSKLPHDMLQQSSMQSVVEHEAEVLLSPCKRLNGQANGKFCKWVKGKAKGRLCRSSERQARTRLRSWLNKQKSSKIVC